MIITVSRKPFNRTVCENLQKNQCGGLNIEGTKIGSEIITTSVGAGFSDGGIYGNGVRERKKTYRIGRFPANIILQHTTIFDGIGASHFFKVLK